MRVLKSQFPDIKNQVFLQDLYKRKQKIRDKSGNRLYGSAPYDFDPGMERHFAWTWRMLEKCQSVKTVLLWGRQVREAFVKEHGDFKKGGKKVIGGRQVQIFHMRHPEHTGKYATKKQLVELRETLRSLPKSVTVDLSKLDARITSRDYKAVSSPPTRRFATPSLDTARKQLSWMDRIDLAPGATRSEIYSAVWQLPDGPWAKASATWKAYWASEQGVEARKGISKRMLKFWASPEGLQFRQEWSVVVGERSRAFWRSEAGVHQRTENSKTSRAFWDS